MSFTWTLNWDEIRHDLVIGSCPRQRGDLDQIKESAQATAILSLQEDSCHAYWGIDYPDLKRYGENIGVEMCRSPMRDMNPEMQGIQLLDTVQALHALMRDDHRVYVHCTAGMGRAPLTVVAYLNLVEKAPMNEAFHLVKSERNVAVPSPEALWDCRQRLTKTHRHEIADRAYLRYQERERNGREGDFQAGLAERGRRGFV